TAPPTAKPPCFSISSAEPFSSCFAQLAASAAAASMPRAARRRRCARLAAAVDGGSSRSLWVFIVALLEDPAVADELRHDPFLAGVRLPAGVQHERVGLAVGQRVREHEAFAARALVAEAEPRKG